MMVLRVMALGGIASWKARISAYVTGLREVTVYAPNKPVLATCLQTANLRSQIVNSERQIKEIYLMWSHWEEQQTHQVTHPSLSLRGLT